MRLRNKMLVFYCFLHSCVYGQLKTRWTDLVNPARPLQEYPRPQMVRSNWQNLNGIWEYAITDRAALLPKQYTGTIVVPYPIESELSGVRKALLPTQLLWYKKSIPMPSINKNERVLLHFGAVDWQARVYVNGKEAGSHTGGYQQFTIDITNRLQSGLNELVVSVYDPTDEGPNPHGKQALQPQNIVYTSSSGIWQTVWLETVPAAYIRNLQLTPAIDSGHLRITVTASNTNKDYTVEATSSDGRSAKGLPNNSFILALPNAHLWSPDDPYLYGLNVHLLYKGKVVDTIGSYFGMRKIDVQKDSAGIERLFLNNKYTYHLGVLDQGFWPDGLYTAPTDDALQFDIQAIRNMGFNTIRKHVKIEPDRWYYHADRLGVLVWQDMVTPAGGSPEAQRQFEKENYENIGQLYNHPSIVIWVPFNEGWYKYNQRELTERMKAADPSRLVNGQSGENYDRTSPENPFDKWAGSDMTDIHDYPGPGMAPALKGKVRVLGEWGGVRVVIPDHEWNAVEGWGYIQESASGFERKYEFMLRHLKLFEEEGLSGSIYTQPFDVETEENGLMTYDRELIKIAPERLRVFHSALVPAAESYASNSISIQLADTTNPDSQYANLLQQYKRGNNDPGFLRNLALMAMRQNDRNNAASVSGTYIRGLKDPFTRTNLLFINRFTHSIADPGFNIFLKNHDRVDAVLGNREGSQKVMSVILKDEITPFMAHQDSIPQWTVLEKQLTTLYDTPGEEIFLRVKAIRSYQANDWNNFSAAIVPYIQKYGDHVNPEELAIFGRYINTNAALLYSLGQKSAAIQWQEMALSMAQDVDKAAMKEELEKMKTSND